MYMIIQLCKKTKNIFFTRIQIYDLPHQATPALPTRPPHRMCKLGNKPRQLKNLLNLQNFNKKFASGVDNSNYPTAMKYSRKLAKISSAQKYEWE